MPRHLLPRNSGAHRIAAIALYCALLTQCRALSAVQQRQRDELQNIVRNRFKQARYEQSVKRLRIHFEAGYEAIDHLDAAVAGDEGSRGYIVELLDRAPERVKQAPPVVLPKKLQRGVEKRQKREDREKGQPMQKLSLFDRPLPLEKLSGRRHVPVLFSAQKIPVLRLTKPQPENLSGYLAHRQRVRQKRHDTRHRLDDELEIARSEDRWDSLVAAELPEGERTVEPAWSAAVSLAKKELGEKLEQEKRKNREMGVKMQGVVDRERELSEKEKGERRRAKRERWLAKLKEWREPKKLEAAAKEESAGHKHGDA